MANLQLQDRLQPALLDRLRDDHPEKNREPVGARVMTVDQLREAVIRDLGWLLNTSSLGSVEDLESYPHVKNSVLNYGLIDLAGSTASSIDLNDLEKKMRQVIIDFEPRLGRRSTKVKARIVTEESGPNRIMFEIESELWARPLPLHLCLETNVDLESGEVLLEDVGSFSEED
jgi:type VI secretion system protein ImpF